VTSCNLCGSEDVELLIDFGSHPIAHRFLDRPDGDEYRHPVLLGFCGACGLTQLIDPIPPERLYDQYHWLSSWKWNPHLEGLLAKIEELPGLTKNAQVLEVGSNDGSFLTELRTRGYSRLLGLEPAEDARHAANEQGVETLPYYFVPEAAQTIIDSVGQCDLFVARQVLEHVASLREFAEAMRIVLRPGARVLVEVPDFGFNQSAPDYSAIWEEHVNHFTRETLTRFLADAGVVVEACEGAVFSGQILIAFGRYAGDRPQPAARDALPKLRTGVTHFRERWPRFRSSLRAYLERERIAGRTVAVYGAGCRSSTLINFTAMGEYLECVLDDQREKQWKYMPGSHLRVLPGDDLARSNVDTCLLAVNAENEEVLIKRRAGFAQRGGRFVSIHPPSPRLPDFWTET
jgi:SAM-dependent methyltransferase